MAAFIKRNHLDNYTIIAQRSGADALLPYLPGKTFWYAGIEDYRTFVSLNKKSYKGKNISNLEVISKIEKAFPEQSKILLLLSNPLNLPESSSYKLLYKVDKVFGYNREKYYLYIPVKEES